MDNRGAQEEVAPAGAANTPGAWPATHTTEEETEMANTHSVPKKRVPQRKSRNAGRTEQRRLTLADVTIVQGAGKTARRVSGSEVAQLLTFAKAWVPNWPVRFELEDTIWRLRGVRELLMSLDAAVALGSGLFAVQDLLGVLEALLVAETSGDLRALAGGYRLEPAAGARLMGARKIERALPVETSAPCGRQRMGTHDLEELETAGTPETPS
jgi:hypothetical protein